MPWLIEQGYLGKRMVPISKKDLEAEKNVKRFAGPIHYRTKVMVPSDEPIPPSEPEQPKEDKKAVDLKELTVKELDDLADEKGIDLSKAKNKKAKIKSIKAAFDKGDL